MLEFYSFCCILQHIFKFEVFAFYDNIICNTKKIYFRNSYWSIYISSTEFEIFFAKIFLILLSFIWYITINLIFIIDWVCIMLHLQFSYSYINFYNCYLSIFIYMHRDKLKFLSFTHLDIYSSNYLNLKFMFYGNILCNTKNMHFKKWLFKYIDITST